MLLEQIAKTHSLWSIMATIMGSNLSKTLYFQVTILCLKQTQFKQVRNLDEMDRLLFRFSLFLGKPEV